MSSRFMRATISSLSLLTACAAMPEPPHPGERPASPPPVPTPTPMLDAGATSTQPLGTASDARVAQVGPSDVSDAGADRPGHVTGRSSGCGGSARGSDAFDDRSVRIGEHDRTYHVRVPATYDPSRAYPLVFRWHGRGGSGLSGGLDIEVVAGADAIIVAADGIDASWTRASEDNDLQLFDAMLAELSQQYCVALSRVFAYGFSAGAGFTNLLGCKRADKLRATAAIASFNRSDASCDAIPMAAWFRHDRDDPASPVSQGYGARDRGLRRNGCSNEADTVDGCARHRDCMRDHPVVWCETGGRGHDIAADTAPSEVWAFFSSLP